MLKSWKKISDRENLFKKIKKSRLHIDKDNHKEARNEVQKLIHTKKKAYFKSKLMQLSVFGIYRADTLPINFRAATLL